MPARFILPAEVARDAGEGWGRPVFTGCTHGWLLQNKDVRNLDPDGSVSANIQTYMQSAQEKFTAAQMDRWYRFLFRKASGASVSCTPNITRNQIIGLLCMICAKLLPQDQQGAISDFLGHCLGKFSPPAVQRAEQEAPPPPKSGDPKPLKGGGDDVGGGTGGGAAGGYDARPAGGGWEAG
eukprot:gene2857-5533_t